MNLEEDDDEEWIGEVCETGDACPVKGYWEQVETGEIDWHEAGDRFPELEPSPNYKRGQYRYMGKKK